MNTLIISKTDASGSEKWICWIEGLDNSSQEIHSVAEGVKWAFKQGYPVSDWKFHDTGVSLSADSISFSAYQVDKHPEIYTA